MRSVRSIAMRTLAFAGAWWALTEGSGYGLVLGAICVAAAVAASIRLAPSGAASLRWSRLPGFTWYFLRRSLAGGFDVARAAIDPRLPIAPGYVEYSLGLAPGTPRMIFVSVVSLLPGTLSVMLENDRLTVHVLDERGNALEALDTLERLVAALFVQPGDSLVPRPGAQR